MAQLKDLIVNGASRFIGPVYTNSGMVAFGTCSTAAATAAKEVVINDPSWTLKVGNIIGVKATTSNSASNVTLNVNGTGAKSIYYDTYVYTGNTAAYTTKANAVTYFIYDGTYWVWIDCNWNLDSNTYTSAYCTTGASTAAKTASLSNYALKDNSYTFISISNANTAQSALTLNINSKGAKPIYINGTASSATNYTLPAGTYIIYYDGTNYQFRTDGKIPNLATVATSGSYNDLSDKPTSISIVDSTGKKKIESTIASDTGLYITDINSDDYKMLFGIGGSHINRGIYDYKFNKWLLHADGSNVYLNGAVVPSSPKFTDTTYSDATTSTHGLMTAADKTKLNGIATGANNYSLPTASATTLGGIKVGDGLSIDTNGVLTVTSGGEAESVQWSGVKNTPTTLEGYGITDAPYIIKFTLNQTSVVASKTPSEMSALFTGDGYVLAKLHNSTNGIYETLEKITCNSTTITFSTIYQNTLGGGFTYKKVIGNIANNTWTYEIS